MIGDLKVFTDGTTYVLAYDIEDVELWADQVWGEEGWYDKWEEVSDWEGIALTVNDEDFGDNILFSDLVKQIVESGNAQATPVEICSLEY